MTSISRRKIEFSTKRATKLPNGCTTGYAKWRAEAGDFITYREENNASDRESCTPRMARVLGEITKCDADGASGVGLLLVLAISDDGSYGYERWVEPKDVIYCHAPERAGHFLGWLFKADVATMEKYLREDVEVRRAAYYREIP